MVAEANRSRSAPIYAAGSFRSRDAVGALVALTRKALIEEFERELAPLGLNAAQALVIVVLADEGAGTAAEICKHLSHDPGAMTRLIDKLESLALVRRVRGGADRRSARLEVTARGRAMRAEVTHVQVNVLNRMLRGFSRAEARMLERFLKRMLNNAAGPAAE